MQAAWTSFGDACGIEDLPYINTRRVRKSSITHSRREGLNQEGRILFEDSMTHELETAECTVTVNVGLQIPSWPQV